MNIPDPQHCWEAYLLVLPFPLNLRSAKVTFSYLWTYDLYSPMHNVLDVCISITRASAKGLGPGYREFLGPVKWQRADRRVPFGAQVKDMHTSKTLGTWLYKHRCIGGFMHKRPQGRFQGPYCRGWRSRCIKELYRPARASPPPPHYKTYLKSRGNCKVHNMRLRCIKTIYQRSKTTFLVFLSLSSCLDFTILLERMCTIHMTYKLQVTYREADRNCARLFLPT